MSDLISRQAAIDAISCDITVTGKQNAEVVVATIGTFADRIKALPSAQPERKRGRWVYKKVTEDFHVTGQCSVCKERRRIDNYCPNCGADMRGKEGEDG